MFLRKFCFAVFAFFVASTVASAQAAASPFVDVPADYEFVQALSSLKARAVIKGFPDQTFLPDRGISRSEFLKMVLVSSGAKPKGAAPEITFTDVSKEDWFYEVVKNAKALELVKGYDNNTFRPHQGVTRAEALKMMFQAYGLAAKYQDLVFPSDVATGLWFTDLVGTAREKWIMTDFDDGLFRPHQAMTRGGAAEVLYRLDTISKNKFTPFDITTEWDTFSSVSGSFSMKIPRQWSVIPEATRTVFWKEDPLFRQQDYAFLTGLSAKLIVRHPVAISQSTAAEYFDEVKKFSQSIFGENVRLTQVTVSVPALHVQVDGKGVENWYLYLGDRKALILYGEFGQSSLSSKLRETIRAMVRTIRYQPSLTDTSKEIEELMSKIHENILAEKKGKATLELMSDEIILETDEIGVGTGPVDYYFSAKLNLTLKYERASDTILAIRAGKTTKF